MDSEKTRAATLSYQVSELPHCCGVEEIGNVEFEETRMSDIIPKRAIVLLFAYTFLTEREEGIQSRAGRIPRVYCGNGENESVFAEEALLEVIQHAYKHVSTSKNPRSKRTIKMFVSK